MKKTSTIGRSAEHSSSASKQISRVLVNQANELNQSPQVITTFAQLDERPGVEFARCGQTQASGLVASDDLAERGSLKEVYLFDCCGLTRELKPAHAYLATFRTLFHTFNTLVFLFGLANFGMGLWFRIDPKVYEIHKYIETQNFTIAGWILLFGGFLACIMSFVGALAVFRYSISLLLFYVVLVVALEFSFVSTIIMLTVYGLGTSLELFLVKELYEQIRRRTMNTETGLFVSDEAVQFLDYVQVKMRCCGASDFRDYQKLGMVIPSSCYTIAGNYINAPGCGRAIRRLMDIRAGMATGFSTGSAIVQLMAITICGLMICSIYNWRATPGTRTPLGQPLDRVRARTPASLLDR